MSSQSTEERELALVGNVEMKFAMAKTDAKFQTLLNTYLAPLLLKLASDSANVRNKVMSICQHMKRRIEAPSLKLPVAALLRQYKENPNPLIRHFDLLFIRQSIPRLEVEERLDLLPILLCGLKANFDESYKSSSTLFNLLLKLLHSVEWPPRGSPADQGLREKFGLLDKPEDAGFLSTWLGKLILYTTKQQDDPCRSGLSKVDVVFLQPHGQQETWFAKDDGLKLGETKIIASKFIASGSFLDPERFLPALFMSADTDSRISELGEDILKRATSSVSFEDPALIGELYKLYLGTRGEDGSLPVRPVLQVKILSILSKSKLAPKFVEEGTQIVFETLAPKHPGVNETVSSGSSQRQGLEASRLRQQVFAFTNWLARTCTSAEITLFAPKLVAQLQAYIEDQGWPRPRTDGSITAGELVSRSYGYESIGLLASANAEGLLLEPNLHLLRWLFTSLSEDSSGVEVSLSIEQSLSNVIRSFGGGLSPEMEEALTSLFLHHMSLRPSFGEESDGVVRSTQFMAVRFANRCLPYNNVKARWINMLAIRDGAEEERTELVEEGKKGLDPYWYALLHPSTQKTGAQDSDQSTVFPTFTDLIEIFYSPTSGWERGGWELANLSQAYTFGLSYCRNVLLHQMMGSANRLPVIDGDWEQKMIALAKNDRSLRIKLQEEFGRHLKQDNGLSHALERFLHSCLDGLIFLHGKEKSQAGEILIELSPLLPENFFQPLSRKADRLKSSIYSPDREIQLASTHVFGIIGSLEPQHGSRTRSLYDSLISKLSGWSEAIGSEAVEVSGAILGISFLLSRVKARGHTLNELGFQPTQHLATISKILQDSRDNLWRDSILVGISEMSLFGVLSSENFPKDQEGPNVIPKLFEISKQPNEKAIVALGSIAMQCDETAAKDSQLRKICNHLRDIHTVRQAEVQFAVGEALCCAASGWASTSLLSKSDISDLEIRAAPRHETLSLVLDDVFLDCKTTKPALRQASVIWLLCLVQYCGHLPGIQAKLSRCQVVFKSFLADRESLNQESAARGLSLVYEKGDRTLKDGLVKELVRSFTSTDSKLSGTVSAGTELFDEGALPTKDGSITTYKDIMSLASEVGDSSLVYRFMSLASNNAIWSSRAAFGRFGLSTVLSDASTEGYLAHNPKLYPALFRYRFDPNSNVRSAMNDIWTALVKDSNATITKYFDNIMRELLKSILEKEWRVRQASCAAVADLVQGQPLERYESYLSEIWTVTFKVCDDIKDSVRSAAMTLARVLTGILTRELEVGPAESRNASKMLSQVIPFLLSPSGLESGAPDVQKFARKALLEIVKKSNAKALHNYVPELVGRLLALLSSIEHEMINYVHLNADQYGMTTTQLDDARLKHIKGSSLLEAIERCLDFLDESLMPEFNLQLENAIKTVIGLPSKVGCSRVLVSLSTRGNLVFKPYADEFLALARKQLLDRNDTISSSYAVACGYIARVASDKAVINLIESYRRLYFDSEDDRHRALAGEAIYAVSKYAMDRFNGLASDVVPFVFVAKHDTDPRAKSLFEDSWNENVGGSRTVLLYLKEILHLTLKHLDSPRWSVKHTSALAIAGAVSCSGTEIPLETARLLWPALEKALSGKTWEGKETVLMAFIHLFKHSPLLKSDESVSQQMQKLILRESKRNNLSYKKHAMEDLGSFVEVLGKANLYSDVHSIISATVEELSDSSTDAMDVDSGSNEKSERGTGAVTVTNAVVTHFKMLNSCWSSPEIFETAFVESLDLFSTVEQSRIADGRLKGLVYQELSALFGKMKDADITALSATVSKSLSRCVDVVLLVVDEAEQTRIKASEAANALAIVAANSGPDLRTSFVRTLSRTISQERSPAVKKDLDRALKLLSQST